MRLYVPVAHLAQFHFHSISQHDVSFDIGCCLQVYAWLQALSGARTMLRQLSTTGPGSNLSRGDFRTTWASSLAVEQAT